MAKYLPTRAMREHPDLDQLKRQMKEPLKGFIDSQPAAIAPSAGSSARRRQSKFLKIS